MNEPYYLADEKELFAKIFGMSDALSDKIKRTHKADLTGTEATTADSSKLDGPATQKKPPGGGACHSV